MNAPRAAVLWVWSAIAELFTSGPSSPLQERIGKIADRVARIFEDERLTVPEVLEVLAWMLAKSARDFGVKEKHVVSRIRFLMGAIDRVIRASQHQPAAEPPRGEP